MADFLTPKVLRARSCVIARSTSDSNRGSYVPHKFEFWFREPSTNLQSKSRSCSEVQAIGGTYRRTLLLSRMIDSIELGSIVRPIASCGQHWTRASEAIRRRAGQFPRSSAALRLVDFGISYNYCIGESVTSAIPRSQLVGNSTIGEHFDAVQTKDVLGVTDASPLSSSPSPYINVTCWNHTTTAASEG
jgi:hypothetical protein